MLSDRYAVVQSDRSCIMCVHLVITTKPKLNAFFSFIWLVSMQKLFTIAPKISNVVNFHLRLWNGGIRDSFNLKREPKQKNGTRNFFLIIQYNGQYSFRCSFAFQFTVRTSFVQKNRFCAKIKPRQRFDWIWRNVVVFFLSWKPFYRSSVRKMPTHVRGKKHFGLGNLQVALAHSSLPAVSSICDAHGLDTLIKRIRFRYNFRQFVLV